MDLPGDPRVLYIRATAEACLGADGSLFDGLIADSAAADKLKTFLDGGVCCWCRCTGSAGWRRHLSVPLVGCVRHPVPRPLIGPLPSRRTCVAHAGAPALLLCLHDLQARAATAPTSRWAFVLGRRLCGTGLCRTRAALLAPSPLCAWDAWQVLFFCMAHCWRRLCPQVCYESGKPAALHRCGWRGEPVSRRPGRRAVHARHKRR